MASRIRILSESLSNRIAAGEVVEGPLSVVKELVENSIDAGATRIAVDVKGGGSDLIRVTDDGTGMGRDDAVAAFDRFATSKLSDESDIESVETLGFRGEALPSIASVSRVRVVTCEAGSDEGTEVTLVAGEIRDVLPAGRAQGTTMEVSSLFFNTPARRKFLRSDRAETRRILDVLTEYAVLYPGLRFDVAVDGKLTLELLPTDSLAERVAGAVGAAVASELIPVGPGAPPYVISGMIGKPSLARARGALQSIAVNGRPVRDRMISAAIRAGFGELLPRDRHPVVFLMLDIDPRLVDVNVHPTKREVRFGNGRALFAAVERAVRESLLQNDPAPTLAPGAGAPSAPFGDVSAPAGASHSGVLPMSIHERQATLDLPAEAQPREHRVTADEEIKFWQLHERYVFVQTREGVLILDQHAAHERIVYERSRRQLSGAAAAGPSQQMLFPVAVELSPAEWQAFEPAAPLLDSLGLTVKPMSGRTVMIEAVPAAFPRWPHEQILHDILADLPSGRPAGRDLVESIAATCACRASIKAGDPLKQDEMRALVDQLFATELPYSCPHGRPTFMRMTLDELDKRFGRK